MTQVAITGGAGLLGSNLITQLSSRGENIRVIDNFTSGHSSNIGNGHGWLDVRMGDICQREMLMEAFKDVDVVYHLAAQTDPVAAWLAPAATSKVNIDGTLAVVRACVHCKVKRLVFASCGAVYGECGPEPVNEGAPFRPLGPIGITKAAGESYCFTWGKNNNLDIVCLRLFEVYGPTTYLTTNDNRTIPRLTVNIKMGKPVFVSNVECTHDFIYVEDAAQAFALAGESDKAIGQCINIGSGVGTKDKYVIDYMESLEGKTVERIYKDPEKDTPKYCVSDNALAKDLLGWEPTTKIEDGLKKTLGGTR